MIFLVHIKPHAKSDSITLNDNNELNIRISACPVDGKANKHLIGYLSAVFKVPKSCVLILKGLNNPHKTIEILAGEEHVLGILKKLQ